MRILGSTCSEAEDALEAEFVLAQQLADGWLDKRAGETRLDGGQATEDLLFEAFKGNIPPVGTKVRLVLTPKPDKK